MSEFTTFLGCIFFYLMGLISGVNLGTTSKYIGYDEKRKEWDKGYKLGLRKGKEESEKQLVEKLKKL